MTKSRLQKELKKKTPFDSVEQEAHLNVLRTSDLLHHRFGKFLRDYGLTTSQFNVLRILESEGQPLPSLEIGQRLVQAVPAITGLIDRLEKLGFVKRRRCEEDRRVVYVELTPCAEKLLIEIDEPLKKLHRELAGPLTKSELKEITRLMEKLRHGIEQNID